VKQNEVSTEFTLLIFPVTLRSNRVGTYFFNPINETFHPPDEGVAIVEDIDKRIVLGRNHPIGPLASGKEELQGQT